MTNLLQLKTNGIDTIPQKILVYGAPNSGKTLAVGKLAAMPWIKKVIWLDLEAGITTLLQLEDELLKKIQYIKIKDTAQDPIAVRTLMYLFDVGESTVCAEHGKLIRKANPALTCSICKKDSSAEYTTLNIIDEPSSTLVVVDSMTQLSTSALHLAAKNSNIDLASLDANEKTTFNHFGVQGMLLSKITAAWQTLNCHLVVISHEVNLKSEDKKTEQLSAVAGTANFARQFPKGFDTVVRLYVQNGKHVAVSNTLDNAKINAGSRLNSQVMQEGEIDLAQCWVVGEIAKPTPKKKPVSKSNKTTSSTLLSLKK